MKIINIFFKRLNRVNFEILISLLVSISIYIKQFYFFKSGSFQFSDGIILIATILCISVNSLKINKYDRIVLFYLFIIILINFIYFILFSDFGFLYSCLYYIFNFTLILFLFRPMLKNDSFYKYIYKAFELVLLTQLIIYLLGLGRWYSIRYMGTFNDPNQFAFYILSSFFAIYKINKYFHKHNRYTLIYYLITFFLISLSNSAGMNSSIIMFSLLFLIEKFIKIKYISLKNILVFIMLIFIVLIIFYKWNTKIENISSFSRITKRINKIDNINDFIINYSKDRKLRRLYYYYYYGFIGSGEGHWIRFKELDEICEIHSSLLSLYFYYGIIPFIFFIYWLKKNIVLMRYSNLAVYIPYILESFTLINHRQPVFWLLILMAKQIKIDTQNKIGIEINQY